MCYGLALFSVRLRKCEIAAAAAAAAIPSVTKSWSG